LAKPISVFQLALGKAVPDLDIAFDGLDSERDSEPHGNKVQ
jgi:hypothetical protein